MRKIDKAMEMIAEWDYDARHELDLEALDKGLSLQELVIDKFCPTTFDLCGDCHGIATDLTCKECWESIVGMYFGCGK